MKTTNLLKYKHNYKNKNVFLRSSWYITNSFFFNTKIPYPSKLKIYLLRLFGAKIGKNINIKPRVNIKYPWYLKIGSYSWIGEGVWIDNFVKVSIGKNVCISQDAYLLTGNHNYKKESFDLIVKPIFIEDGCWVGAKSIVCPGIIMKSHSILSVGSIATKNLKPYTIYQGNPAKELRKRIIE